ncbi:hypothetical protein ACLB1N_05445 [Escherichia coli]
MSLNMFWFLPTHGERTIRERKKVHARSLRGWIRQQIAQAVHCLGDTGVLIPTGRSV